MCFQRSLHASFCLFKTAQALEGLSPLYFAAGAGAVRDVSCRLPLLLYEAWLMHEACLQCVTWRVGFLSLSRPPLFMSRKVLSW